MKRNENRKKKAEEKRQEFINSQFKGMSQEQLEQLMQQMKNQPMRASRLSPSNARFLPEMIEYNDSHLKMGPGEVPKRELIKPDSSQGYNPSKLRDLLRKRTVKTGLTDTPIMMNENQGSYEKHLIGLQAKLAQQQNQNEYLKNFNPEHMSSV